MDSLTSDVELLLNVKEYNRNFSHLQSANILSALQNPPKLPILYYAYERTSADFRPPRSILFDQIYQKIAKFRRFFRLKDLQISRYFTVN